jgi:DNA polymerase-3 subunit alpha
MDKIISYNSNYHKNLNINQSNLFPEHDNFRNNLIKNDSSRWDKNKKLQMEIEAFGFYLSEHPTKIYKNVCRNQKTLDLNRLDVEYIDKEPLSNNNFIALINSLNERKSKTGKRFCFFNLSDDTNNVDAICFSEVLDNLEFELEIGEIYFFRISKQIMNDSKRLVVNGIKKINKFDDDKVAYNIEFNPEKLNFRQLQSLLSGNSNGSNTIYFRMICNNYEVNIQSNRCYKVNMEFLDDLKSINGVLSIRQTN